jgi:ATP-dependent DNA helicase HFM1/MER3
MDDEAYYRFGDRDRRGPSQFPILQPQFRQPARPVPTRDRYQAPQYQEATYDEVEDDGPYGRDDGLQFDSFGMCWQSLSPTSSNICR